MRYDLSSRRQSVRRFDPTLASVSKLRPAPAQSSLIDCIGETPLVALNRLFPRPNLTVLAKLEFLSPSGSIKDRIVRHIIAKAERDGRLKPGGTIIESTSGNTGAAVAMLAAARGYKAIVVMPEKVSPEKRMVPRLFGAEVVICPSGRPPGDPEHYVQKSLDLAARIPNSYRINQYDNRDNAEAHYLTTGPEIWRQAHGRVDYFVACGSTGGTISGVGRYLKEKNPAVRIVMPDPEGSVYESYFRTGAIDPASRGTYQVEGAGKDCLAGCLDFSVIDEVMPFTDRNAFAAARRLAREEGILAGGTAGANIWACLELAKRLPGDAVIATVLTDSGLKYLSKFYDDGWLAEHCPADDER